MQQAERFWQFSLQVYQHEGVKQACLTLQDRYQLNVNLLLLCQFLQQQQVYLDRTLVNQLNEAIAPSQQVLARMRQHRITLKHGPRLEYQRALQGELNIEKQQQRVLIDRINSLSAGAQVVSNLEQYLQMCGINEDDTQCRALTSIIVQATE